MSSGDSSDRANLGNAFEGDSLSSSTPRGKQTLDFSWMDSFKRESASCYNNDVEGSSRPVGGQDEAEETPSGQVEVSCAYDISMVTTQDACRLAERYGLKVHMPNELCRAHQPPKRVRDCLRIVPQIRSMIFIEPILKERLILLWARGVPGDAQRWAHMIKLYVLFVERKMSPPTLKEFSWFNTLKANTGDQGFYYFVKRAIFRLLPRLGRVLVTGRTSTFLLPRSMFGAALVLQINILNSLLLG